MMGNSKAGITESSLVYHHLQSVLGTVKLVITIRESCKPLKAININRMQFQQLYGSLRSIITNLVNVFFQNEYNMTKIILYEVQSASSTSKRWKF
jgi:hypothetical protein